MTSELYFRTIDFLRFRSRAYKLTFPDPKNNEVLKDLARFCRADRTCFQESERKTLIAIGRHEVWLRIIQHLKLQPDQLYEIYNSPSTISPPVVHKGVA